MIIKSKDSIEPALVALEALKAKATPHQRKRIDTEIRRMKAGANGESSSGYHIDFYYGPSDNWVVIHDLRIEHKNRVAQIDHLVISRTLECFVLESKHFSDTLEINHLGEFTARWGKDATGIESPIEQNKRHITVLEQLIEDEGLAPRSFGFRLTPEFRSIVLVSPKSKIIRPKMGGIDSSMVIKADLLKGYVDGQLEEVSAFAIRKTISSKALKEFAERLAAQHKPIEFDYRSKFGVGESQAEPVEAEMPKVVKASEPKAGDQERKKKGYYCADCKTSISQHVAKFCFDRKEEFGGKPYCMACQPKHRKAG
ncbi:MAG: NERD domain-containing protein [Candidatus Thiodiazotropha endolucinida]|nr:NERD domain-containing protein [Candidatus Thiodiazotropha taylori]MCW4262284.1 NERD domain-containing protein [Candidatus Thiodiazotropha endolucinida]